MPTYPLDACRGEVRKCSHVSPGKDTNERWKNPPLLGRGREPPGQRKTVKEKWGNLFGAKYDVLLYDLTSTYFESDPPSAGSGSKKRFGYSRDKRSDCVQVVVALVLTPEGFPVAYEVYPGNTRDTATPEEFLDQIEKQYGKFRRTWLMDSGIPTEEILEKMRERGIDYLVGTPKGHLTRVEKPLLEQTWM
ncbi:MAG: IS1634 family transposase, partial [Candidatus Brocadia sp. AMX3]|nr:IS1634 family transposase [Candidatus Brocadia sp. AMX3]